MAFAFEFVGVFVLEDIFSAQIVIGLVWRRSVW